MKQVYSLLGIAFSRHCLASGCKTLAKMCTSSRHSIFTWLCVELLFSLLITCHFYRSGYSHFAIILL